MNHFHTFGFMGKNAIMTQRISKHGATPLEEIISQMHELGDWSVDKRVDYRFRMRLRRDKNYALPPLSLYRVKKKLKYAIFTKWRHEFVTKWFGAGRLTRHLRELCLMRMTQRELADRCSYREEAKMSTKDARAMWAERDRRVKEIILAENTTA